MSMTTPSTVDPLSQSLEGLVRQGTLSPMQASELYSAAEARTPVGPIEPPPPSAGWPLYDRVRAGATALGGALALATVLLCADLTGGEFKGPSFTVMAVITVGLAVGAAAWYLLLAAVPHSRWTASVFAAFAIKSLGLTIIAPWSDKDALVYLVGFGMVALSAAGYWYLRGGAFAFSAFVGGFIVANQFANNVIGDNDGPLMYGVIMLLYGIVIAAAGWRFECRNITGLLGGAVALFGFFVVTYVGSFAAVVVKGVNQLTSNLGDQGAARVSGIADMNNDLRVSFILTLLICVALTALYAYSHNVGYLILAAIGATQILSVAVLALAREHPLRWGTILLAGLGGLIALAALIDQARRSGYRRPARPGTPAPVGPPPGQYGPPPGAPYGPPPGGSYGPPPDGPPPPAGPPPAGPPPAAPPPAGPPPAGPPPAGPSGPPPAAPPGAPPPAPPSS